MTQRELERELAHTTGESLATIRHHGFSLVEPPESEPLTVDWDELEQFRPTIFPVQLRERQAVYVDIPSCIAIFQSGHCGINSQWPFSGSAATRHVPTRWHS